MDWEAIGIAVGGSVTLSVALVATIAWLGRSVFTQVLSRDIEGFKHGLRISAAEHQVRYVKLYERRAEVVAELYGLLVEAHWASQAFVSIIDWTGEPTKAEKYNIALNKVAEFYRYFDKNRIYLPLPLCSQLEEFMRSIRGEIIGFGVYAKMDDSHISPETSEKKYNAWIKAAEYFESEVPQARTLLEAELRAIL
jgi:hypothetical protein